MSLIEINPFSLLATTVTSVLSVLLLLAVSRQLWTLRWTLTRDRTSVLPLPKGSMGWPLFGETFHWLLEGSTFHISRRGRYGNVFKTHLLGKPVIRVTGADNIRKILLGEHKLVSTQWPLSTRIILGPHTLINSVGEHHKRKRKIFATVFSQAALESYIPRIQEVVRSEVARWCSVCKAINVYSATKALTFRIAVRVLLGFNIEDAQLTHLSKTFEQLMENLFSLPLDVPFSGLRKGIKARDILHECMENIISQKLREDRSETYSDALDYMMSSATESGEELSIQDLKESAVELIFAAYSTTASASTSLVLQLLKNPSVADKAAQELSSQGVICAEHCVPSSALPEVQEKKTTKYFNETSRRPELSLEKLDRLRYLDCVVKEVLRILPPVSGGYRTALQTFELDGYQIPKGWSVMYSIRDTQETAAVYQNASLFDPDRFGPERDEGKAGRFNYIPFGGGIRSCIGKKLALIILKTLAVELLSVAKLELATATFPKMQTVPIVHPVNGLHVYFNSLYTEAEKSDQA
ncbi:cytochrome P450 26C1 isoform X1 [Erpetoichthys calabaricus]|uniref:Cytochrome P450, family 26, subfamily C, polypeptide 1 n=1 Tax=Erpetoichthys calabaricus TaxID=27687 RepID=A0A8C4RGB2_ERPCA|nr:cytochrome P450 26C1 isoform X1 [Erpetoichthys calabaricus]